MKIPLEVQTAHANFQAARQTLEAFRHEHNDVFETYDELVTAYNAAVLEIRAKYAENYKALGKSFHEFKIVTTREINLDLLFEHVDAALEDKLFETKRVLKDRKIYYALVENGDIPAEIVKAVETEKPTVNGPNQLARFK